MKEMGINRRKLMTPDDAIMFAIVESMSHCHCSFATQCLMRMTEVL